MPPRKYGPDDPKQRAALAKAAYISRNRDRRRAYECDLRARQKSAGDPIVERRREYQRKRKAKARELANSPGYQARKWQRAKAAILADPDRRAAELAKRAKAARFKNSGLSPDLFEIAEITRQLKKSIADGFKRIEDRAL